MKSTFTSQNGQDLYVLKKLFYKRNGYFVEVGVGHGINRSNTYVLEKNYDWDGVLCEPNKHRKKIIQKNRKAKLITNPVYDVSGIQVEFSYLKAHDLSGITQDLARNHASEVSETEIMTTISLNSLLDRVKAPTVIDYISLDTEGSEYKILSTFNFKKYFVKIWTVEHNCRWRSDGEEYKKSLIDLMLLNGYNYDDIIDDLYFYKDKMIKFHL